MGKNKEEFMKDREQESSLNDFNNLIDNVNDKMINLEEELEEVKDLLSKSKTLISDIVMYNIEIGFISDRNDDVMKRAQETLEKLKDY